VCGVAVPEAEERVAAPRVDALAEDRTPADSLRGALIPAIAGLLLNAAPRLRASWPASLSEMCAPDGTPEAVGSMAIFRNASGPGGHRVSRGCRILARQTPYWSPAVAEQRIPDPTLMARLQLSVKGIDWAASLVQPWQHEEAEDHRGRCEHDTARHRRESRGMADDQRSDDGDHEGLQGVQQHEPQRVEHHGHSEAPATHPVEEQHNAVA